MKTPPMDQEYRFPKGTKIRFTRDLDAAANEDHPDIIYAEKGEAGVIAGHDTKEGFWAISQSNPNAPFGVSIEEFEVIK